MVDAVTDTPDEGAAELRVCPKCKADVPGGADACPSCGGFQLRNQAARKLGLYARHVPADLRLSVDQLMHGMISDRGGESELSTLEQSYIRKIADVEIVIQLLTSDVARRGLLTPAGGVRNVHDKLMTALGVFDKLAQRIGLGRRPRDVTPSTPGEAVKLILAGRAEPERTEDK